jgi:hypothetical protein
VDPTQLAKGEAKVRRKANTTREGEEICPYNLSLPIGGSDSTKNSSVNFKYTRVVQPAKVEPG